MMVTVLVLWYGGMLVLHGALNPGALVSFMLYQTQLTSCFGAIADVFTAVTTALGAAEKVLELVAKPPRFRAWPSDDEREADLGAVLRPATCEGRVRLTGVTFAYPRARIGRCSPSSTSPRTPGRRRRSSGRAAAGNPASSI